MQNIEILISAMHQTDFSIFEKTNIQTDALMINQCDCNDHQERLTVSGKQRIIYTTERGLSRSRNLALRNATGDFCLLCDDDELLYEGYAEKINKAYEAHPDADIICFQIKREGKKNSNKSFRVNYLNSLHIASWQISMRPSSILDIGVKFDEGFGSGTPRGAGEENIFLFDCIKAGLKIYYVPVCLGEVAQVKSNWFNGFTEDYFVNRGIIIARMMGKRLGWFYCCYFALSKYSRYKNNYTLPKVMNYMKKGMNSL